MRRRFAEPDEIDEFKNTEGVDNEKRDKPPLLGVASGVPERIALQNNRPEHQDDNQRNKRHHKLGRKGRIQRREWLHISALYHTLFCMRYLGIDYGSSKVGLALSDEAGIMGFPHSIITNTPRLVDELCVLIAKENISAVVIGESRTLTNGENPIAKDARTLGERISERSGTPVFYESEVFTSAAARRAPEKQAKSRSPKSHAKVDASAAALILTSYLSRSDKV